MYPFQSIDNNTLDVVLRRGTNGSATSTNVTWTSNNLFASGSAAAPSAAFSASSTTGLYRDGADVIGIAVAGAQVAKFNAGGLRNILGSAGTPSVADLAGTTGMYFPSATQIGWSVSGTSRATLSSTTFALTTNIWLNQGSGATDNSIYAGTSASPGSVNASFGIFVAGVGSGSTSEGPYMVSRGNSFTAIANQRGNIYFVAGSPTAPGAAEGSLSFLTGSSSNSGFSVSNTGLTTFQQSAVTKMIAGGTTGQVEINASTGTLHGLYIQPNSTASKYGIFINGTSPAGQEMCAMTNSTTSGVAGFILSGDTITNSGFGQCGSTVGSPYSNNFVFYTATTGTASIINLIRQSTGVFDWYCGGAAAGNKKMTLTNGGNLVIGAGGVAGTTAAGVLALSNGATAPTTSVDLVQLYGVDLSAGNATLGLFTETAVAVDAAVVSTHTLTIKINNTNYRVLLAT